MIKISCGRIVAGVLACLLFGVAATYADENINLVINPGAEKVIPAAVYPKELVHFRTALAEKVSDGWGCYNGSGKCIWGATDKEAHSGKYSVFLEFSGYSLRKDGKDMEPCLGICIGNSNGYLGKEAIPVKPDTVYYFSFYLKGNIPKVNVSVTGWDAKVLDGNGREFIETTLKSIKPTENWTRYEGGFVTKKRTGRIVLQLQVKLPPGEIKKGQVVYVDDVEVRPFVIAKTDNGSPRPVKVAIYDNSDGEASGRRYICEALKDESDMAPSIIGDLSKETLKKYDVLILSALTRLSKIDQENLAKGIDWKENLLNFVDCGNGIILGHDCAGYRYAFAQDRLFSKISLGKEQSLWQQSLTVADKNHPVMKDVPPVFSHSYYDHIVLFPGIAGTVLARNSDGNPVIVAGDFARGRIVALGYPMGHWAEKDSQKEWTGPLPESEKTILCNSVRWCAAPARYDVPDLLTRTVLSESVQAYNKNLVEAEDAELVNFRPSIFYKLPFSTPDGNPVGGGKGYSKIVSESSADYVVATKKDLLAALSSAKAGQLIYVKDDAVIDLSGYNEITVPAGVTLASGRGRSAAEGKISDGGIIRTFTHGTFFVTGGPGIRITGLQVGGPAPGLNPESSSSCGIRSFYPLEVDNCHIWGWVRAVSIDGQDNSSSVIHNNLIHHCRQQGLGYGVCVGNSGNASARIEGNIFDYCRHAVAAGGRTSYEAAYNIFGKNMTSHTLDMHGVSDGEKTYMLTNWRFDETEKDVAFDYSEGRFHPRINNLKIYGAVRVENEKYKDRRLGSALQFNGQGDYAECLDASDFKCLNGSVEFWIKVNDPGRCRDILYLHENADNSFLIRKNADDKLELIIKENGKVKLDAVSAKVLDKDYHHVIISGGGGLRIYIDGIWSALSGTGLGSTAWTMHMKKPTLWLGKGPDDFFSGILDEVKFYSRRLDDVQVEEHLKYPNMAGDWLKIHHNIFYSDYSFIVGIRGFPCKSADIYENYFEGSANPGEAIRQYAPSKLKNRTWSKWENGQWHAFGINVHDNVFEKR